MIHWWNTNCNTPVCNFTTPIDMPEGDYSWNVRQGTNPTIEWWYAAFSVVYPRNWYEDSDGDGYGNANITQVSAFQPSGYVEDNTDCDDDDNSVHPTATEFCGDNIDQDCNGVDGICTEDVDGDGWRVEAGDCNDNDPSIYPAAAEICGDGVDQNCDGRDVECVSGDCGTLTDVPLESQYQAAPSNIMMIMDNSGSMTSSFMTTEYEGYFRNCTYVYNLSDSAYRGGASALEVFSSNYWKGRWHEYNRLFYNPNVIYEPWLPTERYPNLTAFADGDQAVPRMVKSHPIWGTVTKNLNANFGNSHTNGMEIPIGHYFARHGEDIFLVTLDEPRMRFFKLSNPTDSTTNGQSLDEVTGADIPPITSRTFIEERQNFANWFTFYRSRNLVANATISRLIRALSNVNIGIYTTNPTPGYQDPAHTVIVQPMVPVRVDGQDESETLLNLIYEHKVDGGGTYLRRALKVVGEFFDDTDNVEVDALGSSPYDSEEDGGACQQAFAVLMTDGHWSDQHFNFGNYDGDPWSNTLADVAMYYYRKDLSDLPDKIPANFKDSLSYQHLVTYAIAFGVEGSVNPDDYPGCPEECDTLEPTCEACPDDWPKPEGRNHTKIDDLYHATLNGRGHMWSAYDLTELLSAFQSLVRDIEGRVGTASSLGVNSNFLTDDTTIYQSSYSSHFWTGDVKAFRVDANGKLLKNPLWSASDKMEEFLDQEGFSARKIFTNKGATGLAFNVQNKTEIGISEDVLKYIRGDAGKEGKASGDFRKRDAPLGDIVSSSPILANGLVFAGGNDGMLHAFDASDGKEVFAYVPEQVVHNLQELTQQNYSHKFFVNATPFAKEMDNNTIYLTSGLGKGGKGYFCLDISDDKIDPEDESDSVEIFNWNYPTQPDPDMDYSYGQAYIVNSSAGWVVIFG
ncbi:MAG: PQQ-binding-like beta-propeller repeat protein, partial [Desulfobacterales bacterium]|nr:PQQ-binding-like beta-propeller repeat protein [Desulfobacterales bacterium]